MTILIFGAAVRPDGKPGVTLQTRVEAALACAEGHQHVRFIPTGAVGRFGPSEASVMANLLMESGVSGDRIQLEETGSDTLSSVRAISCLLRNAPPNGLVMAATSLYHLPRCLILLRLFGVTARPCRPPRTPVRLANCYWWLREMLALPYDAALAIWSRLKE